MRFRLQLDTVVPVVLCGAVAGCWPAVIDRVTSRRRWQQFRVAKVPTQYFTVCTVPHFYIFRR